jgi:hypothetical protein
MRSKFIAAMVVVLSGTTVVLAQTKFSGTLQCSKAGVIEEHVIEVGDRPNHSLAISKYKCTWPKPMEIAGTQSKEAIVTGSGDISGTNGSAGSERSYLTITWANGDKSYIHEQSSWKTPNGVLEGTASWTFTGGTGKLKGIKGKGTYNFKAEPDGSNTYEVEGEYELPK